MSTISITDLVSVLPQEEVLMVQIMTVNKTLPGDSLD
jgi:hypothetical protein